MDRNWKQLIAKSYAYRTFIKIYFAHQIRKGKFHFCQKGNFVSQDFGPNKMLLSLKLHSLEWMQACFRFWQATETKISAESDLSPSLLYSDSEWIQFDFIKRMVDYWIWRWIMYKSNFEVSWFQFRFRAISGQNYIVIFSKFTLIKLC